MLITYEKIPNAQTHQQNSQSHLIFLLSLCQPFPWNFALSALRFPALAKLNSCHLATFACPSPIVVGPKLVILFLFKSVLYPLLSWPVSWTANP